MEYLKTFASGHLLLKTLLYHSGFYLGGLRGGRFPPKQPSLPPQKVVIIQVSVHEVSIPRQSKTLYDKEHEVVP